MLGYGDLGLKLLRSREVRSVANGLKQRSLPPNSLPENNNCPPALSAPNAAARHFPINHGEAP